MRGRTSVRLRFQTAVMLLGGSLLAPSLNRPLAAFNYVVDTNGTWWGIQDAAPPRVDTGSIRATQIAPGIMPDGVTTQPYSTAMNGFGGIKVRVQMSPAPRFNGELMRGFGLQFDGRDRFTTTQSIDLGGVLISRAIYVNRRANWGRWIDSFTNTTKRPMTISVAFGGQSGVGIARHRDPAGRHRLLHIRSGRRLPVCVRASSRDVRRDHRRERGGGRRRRGWRGNDRWRGEHDRNCAR